MLAAVNRLRSPQMFADTIRRGSRAGTATLVLHLVTGEATGSGEPLVGFVVSKQVGSAVKRNTVKRRLRHVARQRVSSLPGSAVLVVRAQPAATSASYAALEADFDRALSRLVSRSLPEGGGR